MIEIHDVLLAAVHAQPAPTETLTDPALLEAPTCALEGEIA